MPTGLVRSCCIHFAKLNKRANQVPGFSGFYATWCLSWPKWWVPRTRFLVIRPSKYTAKQKRLICFSPTTLYDVCVLNIIWSKKSQNHKLNSPFIWHQNELSRKLLCFFSVKCWSHKVSSLPSRCHRSGGGWMNFCTPLGRRFAKVKPAKAAHIWAPEAVINGAKVVVQNQKGVSWVKALGKSTFFWNSNWLKNFRKVVEKVFWGFCTSQLFV